MTNIHLRTLMRPAQLVWATPGMMMILDDDVEEEDNFYINCYKPVSYTHLTLPTT